MQNSHRDIFVTIRRDYMSPAVSSFRIEAEKGFSVSTFGYGEEGVAGEEPEIVDWGDLAML